jgi:hypothetical protein
MQIGVKQGMRLMDDSLMELVRAETIEVDEAIECADDKKRFVAEKAKRIRGDQQPETAETAAEVGSGEPGQETEDPDQPKSWKDRLRGKVESLKDKGKARVEAAADAASDAAEPAGPSPEHAELFGRTTDGKTLPGAYRDFQRQIAADADALLGALCQWSGDASGMRAPSFVLAIKDSKARVEVRAQALWRLEMCGDWQAQEQMRSGPLCRTIVACQEKKRRDLIEAIQRATPEGQEAHWQKVAALV